MNGVIVGVGEEWCCDPQYVARCCRISEHQINLDVKVPLRDAGLHRTLQKITRRIFEFRERLLGPGKTLVRSVVDSCGDLQEAASFFFFFSEKV